MKSFLTNKDCLDNCEIMLKGNNKMITDDKRLAKLLNENYINIKERSSGLKPEKIVCHNEHFDKRIVLHSIIKKYENHSSIIKIKNYMSVNSHLNSNNTLASAREVTSKASYFDDFFYLIEIANAPNFADDNTLTAFANSI